jgi:uncharacterized repeat protein (TIGR01451 family)
MAQAPCTVTDDDDEDTPLESDADLAIVKTTTTGTAMPGTAVRWQLAIVNNGPATAVNVVITDVVPSSLTVIGVSSSEFDCARNANSVTCTVASLAPGGRGTVLIDSVVNAGTTSGTIINIGRVISDTPDPVPSNNTDDAPITVTVPVPPANQPPVNQPPPASQPLPRTGSDRILMLLRTGLVALFLGGVAIVVSRRREGTTATSAD